MAKQAVRKRLTRLALECGLTAFSGTETGGESLELDKVFSGIPNEEVEEAEAVLRDFLELQEGLRSPN